MNVLESRYATEEMKKIWSPETKVKLERNLWIKVLEYQAKNGVEIPDEAIRRYRFFAPQVNLESITARELELKHDVKARIEEFNNLAGFQLIHLGMTSRDLTDNVEAQQVLQSLLLIRSRVNGTLERLGKHSEKYAELPIVARTHNVPAQLTTIGKRFATIAEELLIALERLDNLLLRFPIRGIKGPVGTRQDIINLLGDASSALDRDIAESMGFHRILTAVNQTYPRSLDFEIVSTLFQISSAPSNLANLIRLMSGLQLASEGFGKFQVGSSAMPHKVNPRSSERINALTKVLSGHLNMTVGLVGSLWNEGDVSDSAVRRVALPDAFYTLDGILVTTIVILDQLELDFSAIEQEVAHFLPQVISSNMLLALTRKGIGREDSHQLIREVLRSIQSEKVMKNMQRVQERLLMDSRLALIHSEIQDMFANPESLTGDAARQARNIAQEVSKALNDSQPGTRYIPPEIL